ncbi:MAG: dTMP kinase [Clostridiales Family XIII bacterium]|jgi:dTMP kinase|nr:dTMP kinase [Clostridiales Family XIII bacterium]
MTGAGAFITFEGGDGSGKSTQIKLLHDRLVAENIGVVITREPGGTLIGEQIRKVILDPQNIEMTSKTEMFLYAAARAQIADEVIWPALREGKVVICDRFLDSSVAYQGVARGLGRMVEEVNIPAAGGLVPDLTIYLKIEPDEGLDRTGNRKDRMELQDIMYHRSVAEGYRMIAERNPLRVKVLDATESITLLRNKIWDTVAVRLAKKGYSVR